MLHLTNAQYASFNWIRFWGLAYKNENTDGSGKGGVWSMTERGWDFVKGNISIPRYAILYRGNVIRYEGELLSIQDMTDGWWYKPKVVAESIPHGDCLQISLSL